MSFALLYWIVTLSRIYKYRLELYIFHLIRLLLSIAQRAPLLAQLLANILELNARILAHDRRAHLLAKLHESTEGLLRAANLARLILLGTAIRLKVLNVAVVVIQGRRGRTRIGIGNGHRKGISRLEYEFVIYHSIIAA